MGEQFRQKLEVKLEWVDVNLGNRKEPVELVLVQTVHLYGKVEELFLVLNQETLIVVSKKTLNLKLSTQNLKNVEIVLASNLNTLCLLKSKQILLTLQAINNIKETYCD